MLIQEMGEEPTRSTSKEELEKLCSQIIPTNTPRRNSQKNRELCLMTITSQLYVDNLKNRKLHRSIKKR